MLKIFIYIYLYIHTYIHTYIYITLDGIPDIPDIVIEVEGKKTLVALVIMPYVIVCVPISKII